MPPSTGCYLFTSFSDRSERRNGHREPIQGRRSRVVGPLEVSFLSQRVPVAKFMAWFMSPVFVFNVSFNIFNGAMTSIKSRRLLFVVEWFMMKKIIDLEMSSRSGIPSHGTAHA